MKKIIFLSFVMLVSMLANAGDVKSRGISALKYAVVSDEYNVDVPAGQVMVVGQVTRQANYYDEGGPVQNARISTLDGKHQAFTDSSGMYRLTIEPKDTTIYMFAEGFDEIIIWNYKFQDKHLVTINFYPGFDPMMMNVDKPVIYLYSDNELDAEIKFSCKGDLTFTYPAYNDQWNVSVTENGLLDKTTQKKHPYLFWEAKTTDLGYAYKNEELQGFVISTDTVIDFLESALSQMGLTATEQTDFITFWAPRMIQQPYAFVQFMVDDQYQAAISEMTITPTPDSMRRIFMLFTPMTSPDFVMPYETQSLPSFQRKGFTVIEWGGSEINHNILNP